MTAEKSTTTAAILDRTPSTTTPSVEARTMIASQSALETQTGHSTKLGYTMYGGDV
jgi:hypothetical protein